MNKLKKKNINPLVILTIISSILFLILTIIINAELAVNTLDKNIYNWVSTLRTQNLTQIMTFITNLASPFTIILASLVVISYFYKNKQKVALAIFAGTMVLSYLVMQAAKLLIARPRPPVTTALILESSYSFPSGHSLFAMVFYGLIFSYYFKIAKSKSQKYILTILGSLIILSIGFSRMYLGVHWGSDVIGGYLLGGVGLGLVSIYWGVNK